MIINRELHSNALEIWKIEIPNIESISYLIITDQKRQSTISDYPWFNETDKQFFEPRENMINVQFISDKDFEYLRIAQSDITELTERLLAHVAQAYCDWNIEFLVTINPDDYVQELLEKHKINSTDVSKFKYLSRD